MTALALRSDTCLEGIKALTLGAHEERAIIDKLGWSLRMMSKESVNRAGRRLAEGSADGPDIELIGQWRALHSVLLDTFHSKLLKIAPAVTEHVVVVRRFKRLESIRAKMQRLTTKLTRMQDIAGCRAIVKDYADIAPLIKAIQDGCSPHTITVKNDYILEPQKTGYRGVHLIGTYGGDCVESEGLKMEIQVRTLVQHCWATTVETVDLFTGQNLKSGCGDEKWLRFFALCGALFALLESNSSNVDFAVTPGVQRDYEIIGAEVSALCKELKVGQRLAAYSEFIQTDLLGGATGKSPWAYYLLRYYRDKKQIKVTAFDDEHLEQATAQYVEVEKEIEQGLNVDAVLVSADSLEKVKDGFPNYFALTKGFWGLIQPIL